MTTTEELQQTWSTTRQSYLGGKACEVIVDLYLNLHTPEDFSASFAADERGEELKFLTEINRNVDENLDNVPPIVRFQSRDVSIILGRRLIADDESGEIITQYIAADSKVLDPNQWRTDSAKRFRAWFAPVVARQTTANER